MKNAKKSERQQPVSTVELHNVRIPIYRRTDKKNGTEYIGYLFTYTHQGKRIQTRRATLEEAKQAAGAAIRQMVAGRSTAYTVTPEEHAELVAAQSIIRKHPGTTLTAAMNQWHEATSTLPAGVSLAEAAKFYAEHLKKDTLPTIMVGDLVQQWREAKEREGLSDYYINGAVRRMNYFAASFRCPVASITPAEISAWLNKTGHRGRNLNNTRNAVVTLFSFARSRGYLPHSEKHAAELTDRVKEKPSAIGIYTPGEISRILQTAPEDMRASIAIGAFAGLRSAEIFRLVWTDIKLARGHILVAAEKAKTAQRRLVPISENLAAWLTPLVKDEGRVCPNYMNLTNLTRRVSEICKAAGVPSRYNGLRHSFATYRLALVQSANQVALEMGNSPRKLFTNYIELATPEEAQEWFSVMPTAPGNLVAFTAA